MNRETGEIKEGMKKYILLDLLVKCKDFKSEKSDLEQLSVEILALVDSKCDILFTSRFYCELAGEGIEYSWGAFKRIY